MTTDEAAPPYSLQLGLFVLSQIHSNDGLPGVLLEIQAHPSCGVQPVMRYVLPLEQARDLGRKLVQIADAPRQGGGPSGPVH